MIINDLVSIVIPVYNGERFLHQNIECVLNQTYRNLEIIYVCDGCADKSADILQDYSLRDARLKVHIEKENHGAAISRNIGMERAKGDWIIFLDCDDLFETNMIEIMLGRALQEGADMCCCFWENFDDEPAKCVHTSNAYLKLYCATYPVINVLEEQKHILQLVFHCPWGKLIHKTVYKKEAVFFQNLPNCNDAYFSFSAAIEATKIVYVEEAFVHYRSSKDRNVLSTDRENRKNYVWEAYDKLYEYICQKDNNRELKQSFYNRVCMGILNLGKSALYKSLYNSLYDIYFKRWEMWDINIQKELSYYNREIYKKVYANDLSMDRNILAMQAREHFIRDVAQKSDCAIWGCGYTGLKLLEKLENRNIEVQHIYDSDPDKWGLHIAGKTIENFEENWIDNIIVTSSKYYEEIRKQVGGRAGNVYDLEKEILLY